MGHSNKMRRFLFLQGPHGPFFRQLSKMLRKTGADTFRVGFNKGDEIFWGRDNYIPFTQDLTQWPDTFSNIVTKHTITDVVLYGDTWPIHKQAIEIAQVRNITIHVFEEGYMRPYWITYERNGSNGNSRLMDMSLADMQQALHYSDLDTPMPSSHWGDTRQHIFYGAVYHWLVMFANRKYRHFKSHRRLSVQAEFALYLKRLLMMPFHHIQRRLKTHQIIHGEFPYHLVLLQLELLRGCDVTVYGQPFYSGWGLTRDREASIHRRGRLLDLETLVHRTLIDYPRYFDPVTQTACPVEVILMRIKNNDIPKPSVAIRTLSKLQGLLATAAPFWR